MSFSIRKLFQDASSKVGNTVKSVEHAAANTVKTVENAVAHTASSVKDYADTFEKGVVEPMIHLPSRDKASTEPALYKGDGQTTHYGTLQGGQLTVDGIQSGDINQGRIGDCYFLSSMASVAQTHPELIQKAITQNADGTYTVKFHQPPVIGDILRSTGWGGVASEGPVERFLQHFGVRPTQTKSVVIDGKIPLDQGSDPYVHNGQNELWPMLMEKAFAKEFGGYTAIGSGGMSGSALMAITGAPLSHVATHKTSTDALWAKLSEASAKKQPMVATTGGSAPNPMIVTRHCYSVFGTEVGKDGQRYVICRNPWGSHEPGNDGVDDGVFKMPVEEFQKNFNAVDIAQT